MCYNVVYKTWLIIPIDPIIPNKTTNLSCCCENIQSLSRLKLILFIVSFLITVNVVIFAGGKFRENVGKTFHVGVIFTILLIFPS